MSRGAQYFGRIPAAATGLRSCVVSRSLPDALSAVAGVVGPSMHVKPQRAAALGAVPGILDGSFSGSTRKQVLRFWPTAAVGHRHFAADRANGSRIFGIQDDDARVVPDLPDTLPASLRARDTK